MNNDDFDNLSWHDSKVYAVIFPGIDNCLKIDIDFILEWIKDEGGGGYKFLVAPAILKFENISDLNIKIELNDLAEIFIDEIKRINARMSPNSKMQLWDYTLLLNVGEITFTSIRFNQEFTSIPQLGKGQTYDRK